MCDKKILTLVLASLVVTFSPLQAFAEESIMTPKPTKPDRMRLMQATAKAEKLLLHPTMKLMSMEEQMTKIEQKSKLRQQTFRSRLGKLKDENKKAALLKIDTKIGSISANSVMVMSDAVNRMADILNKAKEKAAAAKAQGIDTTALDAAITEADAALDAAEDAVTQIAAKDYQIPVTTDEDAKTNAGQTASTMRNDLTRTHQTVMAAKQAVMKVFVELKKVLRQLNPNALTPTATTTEQPLPTATIQPTIQPTAVPSPTMSDEEQPAE